MKQKLLGCVMIALNIGVNNFMKTITFNSTLKLYILEDDEIGAIINFTEEEFNRLVVEANVEKIINTQHLI